MLPTDHPGIPPGADAAPDDDSPDCVGAEELGLADYQWRIYRTLLAQPGSRIPKDALPTLARWLDRIDFGPLLVTRVEAAEIMGVGLRTVERTAAKYPQWLSPLVHPYGTDGVTPIIELWLGAKVEGWRRWKDVEAKLPDLDI